MIDDNRVKVSESSNQRPGRTCRRRFNNSACTRTGALHGLTSSAASFPRHTTTAFSSTKGSSATDEAGNGSQRLRRADRQPGPGSATPAGTCRWKSRAGSNTLKSRHC